MGAPGQNSRALGEEIGASETALTVTTWIEEQLAATA